MNFCTAAAFAGFKMQGCSDAVVEFGIERDFMVHLSKHGLSFGTPEEYEFRMNIFAEKDAEYKLLNADEKNTFTVGHNKFSTWTKEEFKRVLGAKVFKQDNVVELPETKVESIDWRTKGAVNAVKNQGQCGSCWAFSAISSLESHNFIQTGTLLSLSEQQLVDCDGTSQGCGGGWQYSGYEYLETHLSELESSYPYLGQDGTCNYKKSLGKVGVESYTNVKAGSVKALKAAIFLGPTAVTIEADQPVFQGYTGGVLNSAACGTQLDHAVTAVGFGKQGGQEYYIVRNSWGASWGEAGYLKIAAVKGDGICGIQMQSLYPKAK